MKKKVLALFLSAALCVTVLPATGMAAEFGSGDAEITENTADSQELFSAEETTEPVGDTEQPTEDSEDISEEMVDNSSDATMEDVENAENSEDAFGGAEEGVSEEISSEDDPEVLLTELIPEEAGDSMEEENAEAMSASAPELTVPPTAGPEPTVPPTADPELTVTPTPVPKINVKWTGEKWVSRSSVNVTLKVDANGACYYKAVARKKDGTSVVPKLDMGSSRVVVTANRSFVIYLKNLDIEKEFDLYLKVLGTDGRTSGLKKLRLNSRGIRPAYNICHRTHTACIGHRMGCILSQKLCKLCFHTSGLSFHIHCMDQKFVAEASKPFHQLRCHDLFCKFLPSVCDNIIFAIFFAAAQVKYKMFFPCSITDLLQIFPGDHSVFKHIGGYDHVAGASLQIFCRILRADAASDLKPSGIFSQSLKCLGFRCFIVRGILSVQKDHMTAL